MNKNGMLAGLAVMAGLIVAGAMLPLAVKEYRAAERFVSVKGLCEREVKADKVIWPLQFKVADNSLSSVYQKLNGFSEDIRAFLLNRGIEEDCISVSMPNISDNDTQEYGSNNRAYRFIGTGTVVVCTNEVDKVLALSKDLKYLQDKGINLSQDWDSQPVFSFEGLNDLKPAMIQEATMNAREVAQKFAEDSQSRLGKIKDASQGSFSIEQRDSFTPDIMKVRVVTSVSYYLKK